MTADTSVTRALTALAFHDQPAEAANGCRRWLVRSQNFTIEWIESVDTSARVSVTSDREMMILVFGAALTVECGGNASPAPARSVVVVSAGTASLTLQAAGSCAVLASQRSDLAGRRILNDALFATPDPRVAPSLPGFRGNGASPGIKVIPIDGFAAPASNPRLKMLQSETMSINWVEYEGPRDRRSLSPHSHANLEQASLAVAGKFVHHLREPWGKDANLWAQDRHVEMGSPSVLVVPVHVVHTSEGTGEGRHLLIDVFSPPRRDFIAKGWVHNAESYVDRSSPGSATPSAP